MNCNVTASQRLSKHYTRAGHFFIPDTHIACHRCQINLRVTHFLRQIPSAVANIKHLPVGALEYLLKVVKSMYPNYFFPDLWRESAIIPIPNPGKMSVIPFTALTNVFCKTMERMTISRLANPISRDLIYGQATTALSVRGDPAPPSLCRPT